VALKLVAEEPIKTTFGGLVADSTTKILPPPAFFNRPPTKLP
jgi:transcription initiation factor TFIID TATA-box-binding protein